MNRPSSPFVSQKRKHHSILLAAPTALLLVLAGCGDSGTKATTVAVKAVDYGFEGLPPKVGTGSTFTLTNASKVEAHELIAMRLPDGERRPAAELVRLPEDQLGALFGPVSEALDNDTMRALNARVDVDGEQPEDVARDFLEENELVG